MEEYSIWQLRHFQCIKSREFRLRFIHNNVSNIISELNDDMYVFLKGYFENNEICCQKCLHKSQVEYLEIVGKRVEELTNSIISYIDVLPPKEIKVFNDVIASNAFARVYYHQYREYFTKETVGQFQEDLSNAISELKNCVKVLES